MGIYASSSRPNLTNTFLSKVKLKKRVAFLTAITLMFSSLRCVGGIAFCIIKRESLTELLENKKLSFLEKATI